MKQGQSIRAAFEPERIMEIRKVSPAEPLEKQRTMSYYVVPEGKRLTEYEQLTAYAQQSADYAGGGIEVGEYQQKHAGGRGAYANETTEVINRDWFKFRDPDRRWFYPAVKAKAEDGRTADRFMKAASSEGLVRLIERDWIGFLDVDFGALTFYEYGLFNAHSSATKDSISDFVKTWVALTAFDKNDAAQMVQTERVFLSKQIENFDADLVRAKEVWTKSPIYAGIREAVERLWGDTYDWGEILWASHAIIDAIYGQFVRREFFQRIAPAYGDNITPWFLSQASGYAQTAKGGVRRLFGDNLANDPDFGLHNRAVIRAWTDKWLPVTLAGLRGFVGIYAQLPNASEKVAGRSVVEEGVERVMQDWATDFAHLIGYEADVAGLVAEVMSGMDPALAYRSDATKSIQPIS
ncbi:MULTISPECIES: methane monooxygenase [Xanthobacter]|uniref:methane monooxygenase n=1 Tax=Xanthobacter TaxID=279 RepID=UPI0024A66309|nr:methane monooxygenase [Xanthobacter autotrophicus]MDI4655144.1 methane monooxygenase [Xanthobacter autotrophicus]